jgi:hypothetical protein
MGLHLVFKIQNTIAFAGRKDCDDRTPIASRRQRLSQGVEIMTIASTKIDAKSREPLVQRIHRGNFGR